MIITLRHTTLRHTTLRHLVLVALLAAGCRGDQGPGKTDPAGTGTGTGGGAGSGTGAGTGTGTGTATGTASGASAGTGTGTSTGAPQALAFLDGPTVTQNPNPYAPLVWILTATTNRPTSAEVTITDPERTRIVTFPGERDVHDLDLLDLVTGADNTVVLAVVAADGERLESAPLTFLPPVVDVSDQVRVDASVPERMEPGLTLLRVDRDLVALAPDGETRWVYGPSDFPALRAMEAHRIANGNLRIMFTSDQRKGVERIIEIDARGNTLRTYAPAESAEVGDIPIAVPAIHHDVQQGPGDTLVFPTIEARLITDYPGSEADPRVREDATVIGDVITEIAPDGTVLASHHLLDLLDPRRVGYDSVDKESVWDELIGTETRDWSHVNSVVYDPVTDGYVVSIRHQDAVIHIDRGSGELSWILGPHANWGPAHAHLVLEPSGEPTYPNYHQHAANLTDTGTVVMFDNGNRRACPWSPPLPPQDVVSRAVEVRVDTTAMTGSMVWSYERDGIYSEAQGDADWQPVTGNVLVVYGSIVQPVDGIRGRAVEVTRTTPAEVVWELALTNRDQLYRAERIPTLYPPDVTVLVTPPR